jgi:RNA polymerase sigma-70 factor (ECF subfamily)
MGDGNDGRKGRRGIDESGFAVWRAGSAGVGDQPAEDAVPRQLVELARRGNALAFERLYLDHRAGVVEHIAAIFGGRCDAEDVAEETFRQAYRDLADYVPLAGKPWRLWLFKIARNCAIDRLRRDVRVELVEPLRLHAMHELSGGAVTTPAGRGWIDDDAVLGAFDALSELQQCVLTVRYVLDLNYVDTARLLELSTSNAKEVHRRALARLRRDLGRVGWAHRRYGEVARLEAFMTRRTRFSPVAARRRLALAAPARGLNIS